MLFTVCNPTFHSDTKVISIYHILNTLNDIRVRINSSDTIYGYPILKIRKLLKRVQDLQFSTNSVRRILEINDQDALLLLQELERNTLVEYKTNLEGKPRWSNTENGNQLALSTAAQPIKRETATQRIKDLLDRIVVANENAEYLFRVNRVVLFGSYLSNRDRINDVDVAIELKPKTNDPQSLIDQTLNKAIEAADNGRQFSSFMHRLLWPQNEIILFLKSRSRALSLHDMDDDILAQTTTKTIFDIEQEPNVLFEAH